MEEKPIENRDFDSLSEALNALLEKGFKASFTTKDGYFITTDSNKKFRAHELKIVQKFRFEGISNPSDQSELMAIIACDGTRGTIITNYSFQSNLDTDLIREIPEA